MDSPLNHGSSGGPTRDWIEAFKNAKSIGCSVWFMAGSYARKLIQPTKKSRKIASTAINSFFSRTTN